MNEMISTMTWPTFFSELYRQVKELIPEPETPNPENGDDEWCRTILKFPASSFINVQVLSTVLFVPSLAST